MIGANPLTVSFVDILIGWSDFNNNFLPAARDVLRGIDPYSTNPDFFAVPWTLYLILPLAPLPNILAALIWLGIGILASLASLHYAAQHFGLEPSRRRTLIILGLLLTPLSLAPWFSGQLTPLMMLGTVGAFAWRNTTWPLLLLSLKPHLGWLPAAFLVGRLVRAGEWSQLIRSLVVLGAVIASSLVVVPNAPAQLWNGILSGRSLASGSVYLTSIPAALERLGLSPPWAFAVFLIAVPGLLFLWLRRRDLASLGVIVLLVTPYARNYDYNFVLLPGLYLIRHRYALPATLALLLFPLYRLFVGDITWSWTDIIVPLGLLMLLVLEARRAQVRAGWYASAG